MRGAPITVRCDCGARNELAYGQQWRCEDCGRIWDTSQIPADEYWGLMREMRRYRLTLIGTAVAVSLAFGLLAVFVSEGLFLLLPVALAAWLIVYMPFWRRKVRRRARSSPRWSLRPE